LYTAVMITAVTKAARSRSEEVLPRINRPVQSELFSGRQHEVAVGRWYGDYRRLIALRIESSPISRWPLLLVFYYWF